VRRDFRPRLDVAQIDADALHDAILERIFVDRRAALAKMPRRIDMRAAVIRHGEIHHAVALDIAGIGKGFFVGLPHTMDDGRLPRITWRAVIEFAAQIDYSHYSSPVAAPTLSTSPPHDNAA